MMLLAGAAVMLQTVILVVCMAFLINPGATYQLCELGLRVGLRYLRRLVNLAPDPPPAPVDDPAVPQPAVPPPPDPPPAPERQSTVFVARVAVGRPVALVPVGDPLCPHLELTYRGSNQHMRRASCRTCGEVMILLV
jgi:hypothetical protein